MRQLKRNLQRFASSTEGNFAIITAVTAVPLALAVGLAVDFSTAVNQKSSMQNALDSATLSLFSMPINSTTEERATKLQNFYAAAGGSGTTTLHSFVVSSVGAADVKASASGKSQTGFMNLANISEVDVDVLAKAHKAESLVEATFSIAKVSGYYNKTVTLYGVPYGSKDPQPLMQIKYTHNKSPSTSPEPKGYGLTIAEEIKKVGGNITYTVKQKKSCTSASVAKPNNIKELVKDHIYSDSTGKIITSLNQKSSIKYDTTCENLVTGTAKVDVSEMKEIYLEMYIPPYKKGVNDYNPQSAVTRRTDNVLTAKYMYIDGKYDSSSGRPIDIFSAVPCDGKSVSNQAWEDGGSTPGNGKVDEADFFYTVTGRCDFNRRPDQITMTR